ncbi:hypothetical protein D9M72_629440 [compost metagenome]
MAKSKLEGSWTPTNSATMLSRRGKAARTSVATPTISQRAAYFSRSFFRRSISTTSPTMARASRKAAMFPML